MSMHASKALDYCCDGIRRVQWLRMQIARCLRGYHLDSNPGLEDNLEVAAIPVVNLSFLFLHYHEKSNVITNDCSRHSLCWSAKILPATAKGLSHF